MKKIKLCKFANIISILFFFVLITYALLTVYSADDYMYSMFFDDGIIAGIQNIKNHYLTFNGRTLVHLFATAILHYNNIVFAIVFSVNVVIITYSLRSKKMNKALFWLLFLGGWILTPRNIMIEGVLWISGFCNYVIPTAIVALLLYNSNQESKKTTHNKKDIFCLIALSFFSGSTTEQSGIAICFLLVIMFFGAVFDNNKSYANICLFEIIFAFIGVISIFLSPATQLRLESETYMPVINSIFNSLSTQRSLFLNSPMLIILIAILPIAIFVTGFNRKEKVVVSVNSALVEICILFIIIADNILSAYCYGILLLLLLMLSVICLFSENKVVGYLLCYAVLTSVIMLFTQSSSYRTIFPMYIVILSLVCNLSCQMMSSVAVRHIKAVMCIVFAFVVVVFGTVAYDMPHYIHNHKIEMINKKNAVNAKHSGIMYYCMDYDEAYTHTKAYNDGFLYSEYIKTLRLPKTLKNMFFYSEKLPVIFVNGERITSPGILDKTGEWLLPMREIVETLGGDVEWCKGVGTEIILNNIHYSLNNTKEEYENIQYRLNKNYYATMLPVRFYKDVLGLEVDVSDSSIYVNRKNLNEEK